MNIPKSLIKRQSFHQTKCTANYFIQKLYSTNAEEKIEIPREIPRGPTDILRALESTITRDPTAAHFKYHDDPYLIPMSNVGKRAFAMAQEAGRKAAHWVRQENPHLFNHREADPIVEKFLPRIVYNEDSEITEEDLKKVMENALVSDAKLIYSLLKKKGQTISKETEQSLLEFVCFFNSEDTLQEDFIEERWFRQSSKGKERNRKTWKDGSFAEEIFIGIENPTAENYSALIQGMAKYFQVDRAWQLFEEAKEKGLILSTETYNSLIKVANFVKEDYEMRWALITDLLSDMNKMLVKPDLYTLNAVLNALSGMGSSKPTRDTVLKVLKEFKMIGIEPSLGSWYYVLITFCKEHGQVSTILHDIMAEIENQEHTARDVCDTNFFVTAMDICRHHLNDVNLGKRVDALLHKGNNYNLIGDSFKESLYYRHYFILLINNLTFEEFMNDVYDLLVPNIYVPEPSVMGEVIKYLDLNGAIEHVPRIWSDMVIFDHHARENLVNSVLEVMVTNEPEEGSELKQKFAYIAWDMHLRTINLNEKRVKKMSMTGDYLGKIMMLLLRNNEFDKAWNILELLDKEQHSILGVPRIEALALFIDKAIEFRMPSRGIACIQYCADCGFPEASNYARKMKETMTLDPTHIKALKKIVGIVDLEPKIEENKE